MGRHTSLSFPNDDQRLHTNLLYNLHSLQLEFVYSWIILHTADLNIFHKGSKRRNKSRNPLLGDLMMDCDPITFQNGHPFRCTVLLKSLLTNPQTILVSTGNVNL